MGSLGLGLLGNIRRKGLVILGGIFLGGWAIAFFGISTHLWVSMIILGLVGFFLSLTNVVLATLFQSMVPNQLQGRIFGTLNTMSMGLRPISMALAGVLSDLFKVQLVILVSGVLIALGGVYGFFIKSVRRI